MRSLFQPDAVTEVTERIDRLRADSPRQWGTMTPAQAVEHCARAFDQASGANRPPRVLIGRLFGRLIKRLAIDGEEPFRKNSPTLPFLVVGEDTDLDAARGRLHAAIGQFTAAGRAGCTDHPHAFFGRLTPDEWGVLMYKHLDHHLRQFGA